CGTAQSGPSRVSAAWKWIPRQESRMRSRGPARPVDVPVRSAMPIWSSSVVLVRFVGDAHGSASRRDRYLPHNSVSAWQRSPRAEVYVRISSARKPENPVHLLWCVGEPRTRGLIVDPHMSSVVRVGSLDGEIINQEMPCLATDLLDRHVTRALGTKDVP